MPDLDLPAADWLLALNAEEGCRRVALALLDATVAARARLDDRADTTALHDFRVALRRLRSWIRAYDEFIGPSIRKKTRRRLRELSRAAGECRDGEVHVAWLRDVEESLRPRERPGSEWLLRRVAEGQNRAATAFRAQVAEQFGPMIETLADDLAVYRHRIDLRSPSPTPTLADAAAPLLVLEATALGERLAAVHSVQDQAVAHAARMAGKRLRYLLEPIAPAIDDAPTLVKRLRNLQDTIGEMHDVHVMAEEVIEAAERAGAEQARRVATALLEGEGGEEATRREQGRDPRPGLLAIAAQLRARGESAFAELQQRWLGTHAHELTERAREIAAQFASMSVPTAEPPMEATRADSTAQESEPDANDITGDAEHFAPALMEGDPVPTDTSRIHRRAVPDDAVAHPGPDDDGLAQTDQSFKQRTAIPPPRPTHPTASASP